MVYKTITSLLIFLNCNLIVSAQDSVTAIQDSSKVFYFMNSFENQGPTFLTGIDTSITGIQKYDPLLKPGNYYTSLGNVGLANVSMVYTPEYKSGFDFGGTTSFDKYRFVNDSIKYYWVGKPYTHLSYIMGAKKEQNLQVDHSQNIASWFNLGVNFRYTSSPGYYTNQKSDDKNFVIKTRFQTKDYRYVVLANYLHNKIQTEENGGIKYDTAFEQNIEQSRRNIGVNLTSAKNTIKDNSYYIKQFLLLSNRHRFNVNDSTDSIPSGKITAGNISLSTLYNRSTLLYEQSINDTNGFYRFTFDSVNPTYDSTFINRIENQLSWTNADNAKSQLLTFNLSVKHLYAEVVMDSVKSIFKQVIPSGKMNFTVSDILKLQFSADYVSGNAYAGDYHLNGILHLHTKLGDLSYSFTSALQESDRFYQQYSSNHFIWDNHFRKQSLVLNNVGYKFKNLNAGVNLYNIGSFIYMDSLAFPAQLGDNLNVFSVYLRKLTHIGNWSLDARGVYQKASNNTLRVPELTGDISFYYTNDLFKKATILQAGIDVFYNTAYFGYAYMPAIKSFYLQNQKETGDYFYGDVFLNLQIKRARLFLKYVNLGFLFGDFRYYTVPSYPMQDGGFRFGVNWMFYD